MWRPMMQRRKDVRELRWTSARGVSERWYPQGIDVATLNGRETLAITWFRQLSDGTHTASRVTLIDLARPRHRDVVLAQRDADDELQPVDIHAGGLAWFGDRLFFAATNRGIWEFALSSVHRVRRRVARRVSGAPWRPFQPPALVMELVRKHPVDLRCSFIGRNYTDAGVPTNRVMIGEYRSDDSGRIGEFEIPEPGASGFTLLSIETPGVSHMQGAVRYGNQTFVSQSNGMQPGRLWISDGDAPFAASTTPLPVGCEDLAIDTTAGELWTLGEHPWKRVLRAIPFAALGINVAKR